MSRVFGFLVSNNEVSFYGKGGFVTLLLDYPTANKRIAQENLRMYKVETMDSVSCAISCLNDNCCGTLTTERVGDDILTCNECGKKYNLMKKK